MALAGAKPSLDIVVISTNKRLDDEVERLTAQIGGPRPRHVRLRHRTLIARGIVGALDGVVLAAKLAVYRDNLDFFRSFRALVVAEKTSALLKNSIRLEKSQAHPHPSWSGRSSHRLQSSERGV